MASKSPVAERDGLVELQFRQVTVALDKFETKLDAIVAEVAALRSREISELNSKIAVLQDRAGRSGAIAGVIAGAVISGIVSLVIEVLAKR
ncbi:MAG TPA: hypothetical protein VLN57_21085 [Xanthobacteraceae bacterium]|nr:hypothetical protein [Xanthobacteraceae bacterium]